MHHVTFNSICWTLMVFSGFIFSVCLHEFGHAIVAYWGGDKSVKAKGYLTLNPLKYADPTLSLTIPLIYLFLGGIPLPGAAVYINQALLKTRGWKSLVSAAGPLATLSVAVAIALILQLLQPDYSLLQHQVFLTSSPTVDALGVNSILVLGLVILLALEVASAILSLMPMPGLDGFGILEPWLPSAIQHYARKYSQYGIWILFALFVGVPSFGRGLWTVVDGLVEHLGVPAYISTLGFMLLRQGRPLFLVILVVGLVISHQWKKRNPDQIQQWSKDTLEADLQALDTQLTESRDARTLYAKFHVLYQLERYEDSLSPLNEFLELEPNEPEYWAAKGSVCSHLKQYEEAIAAFKTAFQLEPNEALYGQKLGILYTQIEDYDTAIKAFQQVLDVKHDDASSWLLQGRCYLHLKQHALAIASLNQASRYATDEETHATILHYKSMAYFELQRYEDCLVLLAEVLQLEPSYATAAYNQACCYAKLGQVEQGLKCLAQALASDQGSLRLEAREDEDLAELRSHPDFQVIIDSRKQNQSQ